MSSGKFVLRLEPELHQSLKDEAQLLGESLNGLCQIKLSAKIVSQKFSELPLQKIISEFKPVGIAIFGSTVREEATTFSDIDLLLVMAPGVEISRDTYRTWDSLNFESNLSPQFVILPSSPESVGSLWLECAIEGEILYDLELELQKTFRMIRQQIAMGHYIKKISHGQGYWIRQEQNAK